jgi:hypothetical protein
VGEELEQALRALAGDGSAGPALELIAGTPDAHRREHAVSVLGAGGVGRLELLREVARRKEYRAERWLLLGSALAAAAWQARDPSAALPIRDSAAALPARDSAAAVRPARDPAAAAVRPARDSAAVLPARDPSPAEGAAGCGIGVSAEGAGGRGRAGSAWRVAWTGRAGRGVDTQVRRQQALVAEARSALRRAAALDRDDPVPWSELAGVVFAAPRHVTEAADAFRRAAILAPDLYLAHARHLLGLTRRWHGSPALVMAFAQVRAAGRPDGHPLLALVALAHIEGYVDGLLRGGVLGRCWRAWRYFADPEVRRETDAAADRLLAGAGDYGSHPWAGAAHQAFAALYQRAGVPGRARAHLELGGDRAVVWPWRYFGEPERLFAAAQAAAGLRLTGC